MFSEVDNIVFPDSCEVIKVASQHYVFPIFKCGRSSLTMSMQDKGWTFVPEPDIAKIKEPITVFVRDPRERFYSGVNTFLQRLAREENLELDQKTALYFINRYLFLNRHYAPQFFWLLNLSRFAGIDAPLTIKHMSEIGNLTKKHSRANIDPITKELVEKIDRFDWSKLDLYIYLDQLLYNQVGNTITVREILDEIKINHRDLYDLIFQKTIDIVDVLSKT